MSSRRKTSVKYWNTVLTYSHENNQGIVFPYPIATNLKILLCYCVTKVKNVHEKGIEFCHKLRFSNPYILATWWCKPLIFQTLAIWVQSMKYQRSAISGFKDVRIITFEFEVSFLNFLLLQEFICIFFTEDMRIS